MHKNLKVSKNAILILVSCLLTVSSIRNQESEFSQLKEDFRRGYIKLEIPPVQVDYRANLESIRSRNQIIAQEQFFEEMFTRWNTIDPAQLQENDLLDYQIIGYEISLNQERIVLEKEWNPETALNSNVSIHSIPNGKQWYTYLLKRWVDKSVSPDSLFDFGLTEIQKVKDQMEQIRKSSGLNLSELGLYLNDSSFFIKEAKAIQTEFEKTKNEVASKVDELFPYVDQIPDVSIDRGTNAALAHVPAFYSNYTFYYNLFETPFNNRQIDWIYIHEAIPGHHYQISLNNVIERSEIQDLFWYLGFIEGWGAYVEHLGKDLGVYTSIYDEYGKWEWDLIRSVRVCIDIGINSRGWSDEKALAFWNSHIENQEDIALREIARMKRWPAQVITYKYGAAVLLRLLEDAKQKPDFNFMNFHKEVLAHGDIPVSILFQRLNS